MGEIPVTKNRELDPKKIPDYKLICGLIKEATYNAFVPEDELEDIKKKLDDENNGFKKKNKSDCSMYHRGTKDISECVMTADGEQQIIYFISLPVKSEYSEINQDAVFRYFCKNYSVTRATDGGKGVIWTIGGAGSGFLSAGLIIEIFYPELSELYKKFAKLGAGIGTGSISDSLVIEIANKLPDNKNLKKKLNELCMICGGIKNNEALPYLKSRLI